MTTRPLYLKWTAPGRTPSYQGGDPIPYRRWTQRVPNPEPCRRGWHACRWEDVASHIAAELWVVELDGLIVAADNKVAAERLRIVRRVKITDRDFRLFAADCAESVLHNFEAHHPDDDRPRRAIEVVRRYALGEATDAELSAGYSAAYSAARWAADSAAYSAGYSASYSAAYSAARWAARSAAYSAAYWAARWAADSTADSTARSAQSTMLLERLGLNPDNFAHRNPT